MESFTEEGALLVDTYGFRLLRYITASGDDERLRRRLSGGEVLDERAEGVVSPLILLAKQAAAAAAATRGPTRLHLDILGQFQPSLGTSLGSALRLQAGGDIPISIPDEPLARQLALILRDVFTLMLLPEDPWFPGRLTVSSAVFRHPEREAFEAAVAADSDLSRLFPPTLSSGKRPPFIYRSTGSGGTTQLELLPDLLLNGAWTRACASNRDDIASVADELTAVLGIVRRAARGEPCEVPVLVAFTGLLPEGIDRIELPYGNLRPVAEHERALAPPSIVGNLSHTTAEGDTVVVSYAGDLVLETATEYRLRAVEELDTDSGPTWPPELRAFDDLQANIDTTRLAALLAGTRDAPLTLVPTWRMTLDPLNFGPMVGWSDPRTLPGLAPRRLSAVVAAEFAGLARDISAQRRQDFDVAVRRTISGMMTRGDPSDALVDLVIGWENLFGSSQGELRFRISSAIAWVLGSDAASRNELQEQTSKIYDRRSAILHGSTPTPQQIQASLEIARDITVKLLRALFTTRKDVLSMTDGTSRSKALILGQ